MTELTDANSNFLESGSRCEGTNVQKQLVKDPNTVLSRFDLAVLSPAVNTGVDITVLEHFDEVVNYSCSHLSVSDVVQVRGRLKDGTNRRLLKSDRKHILEDVFCLSTDHTCISHCFLSQLAGNV